MITIPEAVFPHIGGQKMPSGQWTSALGDDHWNALLDDLRHERTTIEAAMAAYTRTLNHAGLFASAVAQARDDD